MGGEARAYSVTNVTEVTTVTAERQTCNSRDGPPTEPAALAITRAHGQTWLVTGPPIMPSDPGGFPWPDPVGQHPDTLHDPLVRAARAVTATVLLPGAASTDAEGLPVKTLRALGAAGLMGMAAPAGWKGTAASVTQWREIGETLMAADGTSWFCWSQHHALVRALVSAAASDRAPHLSHLQGAYLPGLVRGDLVAAVSFSHVRRAGRAAVVAVPVSGGWRLDGRVDWVTAWDVADLVLVLAEHEDRLVQLVVPARAQLGLGIGPRQVTLAMAGSHTRSLEFTGLVVPDDHCLGQIDRRTWLAVDDRIALQPSPACFGLARGALAGMSMLADERGDDPLRETVRRLAAGTDELRRRCYGTTDRPDAAPGELGSLRAEALGLALRVATTALAARGGSGLLLGGDAERRYREAAFLLAFRQGPATRSATLAHLAGQAPMELAPVLP